MYGWYYCGYYINGFGATVIGYPVDISTLMSNQFINALNISGL
jgi:hypothetical protein